MHGEIRQNVFDRQPVKLAGRRAVVHHRRTSRRFGAFASGEDISPGFFSGTSGRKRVGRSFLFAVVLKKTVVMMTMKVFLGKIMKELES